MCQGWALNKNSLHCEVMAWPNHFLTFSTSDHDLYQIHWSMVMTIFFFLVCTSLIYKFKAGEMFFIHFFFTSDPDLCSGCDPDLHHWPFLKLWPWLWTNDLGSWSSARVSNFSSLWGYHLGLNISMAMTYGKWSLFTVATNRQVIVNLFPS